MHDLKNSKQNLKKGNKLGWERSGLGIKYNLSRRTCLAKRLEGKLLLCADQKGKPMFIQRQKVNPTVSKAIKKLIYHMI